MMSTDYIVSSFMKPSFRHWWLIDQLIKHVSIKKVQLHTLLSWQISQIVNFIIIYVLIDAFIIK